MTLDLHIRAIYDLDENIRLAQIQGDTVVGFIRKTRNKLLLR